VKFPGQKKPGEHELSASRVGSTVPGLLQLHPALQLLGSALPSGHCVPGGQGKKEGSKVPLGQKNLAGQGPLQEASRSWVVLP
jgi:hypothetical protein